MTPLTALSMSRHMPPDCTSHIEPVRSSTIMMSSGFAEHGEQAVAVACTSKESMPMIRAKNVFTLEFAVTLTALYVLNALEHPGADVTHFISTVVSHCRPPSAGSWYSDHIVLRDSRHKRRVRKLLGTGKRGCVDTGLELTLHEIGVSDVDREPDHRDEDDHADEARRQAPARPRP